LNGILLTIFVSLVMLIGTVTFTTDVETLVLKPIQRMMNMVEQVARDPLAPLFFDHSDGTGEYETMLLEDTIQKITGLLRVGFGEAGAGIISANLNLEDSSSVINPLIPGTVPLPSLAFLSFHLHLALPAAFLSSTLPFSPTPLAVASSVLHFPPLPLLCLCPPPPPSAPSLLSLTSPSLSPAPHLFLSLPLCLCVCRRASVRHLRFL
jgi:hypothetical protein